jgi:hypothetical protein
MLSIARCSLNEPPRGTSLFYFIYLFDRVRVEGTAFALALLRVGIFNFRGFKGFRVKSLGFRV